MFHCTPENLPPGIREQIEALFHTDGSSGLENYMRPGCVFLTADCFQDVAHAAAVRQAGLRATLERMLAASDSPFWTATTFVVRPAGF